MSQASDIYVSQLAGLPTQDRAELAHLLLCSLDEGQLPNEATEAEFEAELNRRVEDVRSGNAKGRLVEDVLADLRRH